METRRLGRSGLEVSVFGFGAMTFGGEGFFAAFGQTQLEEAGRQLDLALEAGVTLIDTADMYSAGRSEEMLGELLGSRRSKVVLATKAFGRMGPGAHDLGLSRRHLIAACEDSLRRLRTDWIDLYQVHSFDGAVPLDETLRALDDLIRAGKVRYVGCSNYFGWELAKAARISAELGTARFVSQQVQYSLMVRDVETEILPAGIDEGVGALIWSPLAGGYLTGKFRRDEGASAQDATRLQALGRLESMDDPRGKQILDALAEIAAGHPGASPGQVALNWLRRRPGVASILIGARTETQLRDNLGAAAWTLGDDEVAALNETSRTPKGYPGVQRGQFHPERNVSRFD